MLLYMPPRDAFCMLVQLMETYGMREMYTTSLAGLSLHLYQFERALAQRLPALAQHFVSVGCTPSMYATQWFLALFACTAPIEFVVRIYDILLVDGCAATVISIGLALLERSQNNLLKAPELDQVLELLLSNRLWTAFDHENNLVEQALAFHVSQSFLDTTSEKFCRAQAAATTATSRPRQEQQPQPPSQQQGSKQTFFQRIWREPSAPVKPEALVAPPTVEDDVTATAILENKMATVSTCDDADIQIERLTEELETERTRSRTLSHALDATQIELSHAKTQLKELRARWIDAARENTRLQSELRAEKQAKATGDMGTGPGGSGPRVLRLASALPHQDAAAAAAPDSSRRKSAFFAFR